MEATRLLDAPNATDREAPDAPTPLAWVASAQEIALRHAAEAAALPAPPEPTAEEVTAAEKEGLTHQLGILGFPAEDLYPEWSGLPQEWRARAKVYLRELPRYVTQGMGMIASSKFGGGKTMLLALIVRAALQHDIECAYSLSGKALLYACKQVDGRADARARSFNNFDEPVDERKRWPWETTPLLLLDDLDYIPGRGYDPEREAWDTIGDLLYTRMAAGLATCICTNLAIDDPQEKTGLLNKPGMDRVQDRALVYLPQSLWVVTERPTQRTTGGK